MAGHKDIATQRLIWPRGNYPYIVYVNGFTILVYPNWFRCACNPPPLHKPEELFIKNCQFLKKKKKIMAPRTPFECCFKLLYLADPGEARERSTNSLVINWLIKLVHEPFHHTDLWRRYAQAVKDSSSSYNRLCHKDTKKISLSSWGWN